MTEEYHLRIVAGQVRIDEDYVRKCNAHWAEIKSNLDKIRNWSSESVQGSQNACGVFYPFSGPDLLFPLSVYPNLERLTLIGKEPAGKMANYDSVDHDCKLFLDAMQSSYQKRGFFVTAMNEEDRAFYGDFDLIGCKSGVQTLLGAFALRLGYTIESIDPVLIDDSGKPRIVDSQSNSCRLLLRDDVNMRDLVVHYIHGDLSDRYLHSNRGFSNFVREQASQHVILKATCHLMQTADFQILRQSIVSQAKQLLQDETGLSPSELERFFHLQAFGDFTRFNIDFEQLETSDDFKRLFDETSKAALPFEIGYRKSSSMLICATRKTTV